MPMPAMACSSSSARFEFDNRHGEVQFHILEKRTSLPLSANARATAMPTTPAPTTRQSTRSTGRTMPAGAVSSMGISAHFSPTHAALPSPSQYKLQNNLRTPTLTKCFGRCRLPHQRRKQCCLHRSRTNIDKSEIFQACTCTIVVSCCRVLAKNHRAARLINSTITTPDRPLVLC